MRDLCKLSPKLRVSNWDQFSGKGLSYFSQKHRALLPCLLDHFDEHLPCFLGRGYLAKEVDASALDSVTRLQTQSEAQAVDRSHRRLGRFKPRMRPSQQNHRINMVSVHMGEDAGREFSQRVRRSKPVVFCRDPSHHAKATDIVKVNRLKAKEAKVREVDPVAAVLMACKIQ